MGVPGPGVGGEMSKFTGLTKKQDRWVRFCKWLGYALEELGGKVLDYAFGYVDQHCQCENCRERRGER